jgi:hypothetical protein
MLAHIKKLDDCFGQFLVRVIRDCGAVREIESEALARLDRVVRDPPGLGERYCAPALHGWGYVRCRTDNFAWPK